MKTKKKTVLLGLFVLLGISVVAQAAMSPSIGVAPINVMLTPDNKIQTVKLINNYTDRGIIFNSKLFDWKRENKKDIYSPSTTANLKISPPVLRLTPKGKQTIRVGMLKDENLSKETLYRLFLTEVPSQTKVAEKGITKAVAVNMNMRIGIPIYVYPKNANCNLAWDVRKTSDGVNIKLSNHGNAHAKIVAITATASGKQVAAQDLYSNLYSGETNEIALKIPGNIGNIKFKITTEDAPVKVINKTYEAKL